MNDFFQSVVSFLLVFPVVIFLVVFLISSKVNRKTIKAFGHAADVTTFFLFFAVSIAFQSVFQIETLGILVGLGLIICILFTVLEWKSKMEIELMPLFQKIWRFLFLVLSLTYIVVWCINLVLIGAAFVN